MEQYQILFEKGYLESNNIESPISMKGVEKLITIFKKKYNFLDIKIINEKEFSDEFYKFNDAFSKIVKKNILLLMIIKKKI